MHRPNRSHRDLLGILKEDTDHHHSGTHLASILGVTRTTVWKQIQTLKSLGYEIHARPKHGYRLIRSPDLLIPEEVLSGVTTTWLGAHYHHFNQIGSTNDHAMALASQGAPHGTVIVAEEQTKGRGRLHRPWLSSPRRGIYMSILLRTPLPIREASQVTLVTALALVQILRDHYSLAAAIKWPNDVLIQGKKVAGILTEMQSDRERARFLVIGVGINVNFTTEEMAGPFRYPGTSVAIELGAPTRRPDLLRFFLQQFEAQYERFITSGFSTLIAELEKASAILGRNIRIRCGDSEYSGKAVGLTPEGALRLLSHDGGEQIVWVGDVTQVWAAT